tara:strand:+ start:37 stop:561 length:525 start_codon:yes stop_codon:yes gene_type:complete
MSTIKVDTITKTNGSAPTLADLSISHVGSVVQSVNFTNNTPVSTNATTNTSTGIAVNITPKFASSKIYISGFLQVKIRGDTDHGVAFKIIRTLSGSNSDIYESPNALEHYFYDAASDIIDMRTRVPVFAVDTPNTTSECTYTFYYKSYRTDQNNAPQMQDNGNFSHGCIQEIKV